MGTAWEQFERVREQLGDDTFLHCIFEWFSNDELHEMLESIRNDWDLEDK